MENDTSICLVLPSKLKEEAKEKAKELGLSLNSLIRMSLLEFLKKK